MTGVQTCALPIYNTVYGDVVLDAVPFEVSSEKQVDSLVLYYKKEAVFNQEINVYCEKSNDDNYFVQGEVEDETCFVANIKFK